MANFDDLLEQGEDILAADGLVDATAHYKLPAWLREQVSAAVTLAGAGHDAQGLAEGARRAASTDVKAAYEDGEKLIREFNRFINNLNDSQDVPVDVAALRAAYELGRVVKVDMTHAYVKSTLGSIARVAPDVEPSVARPRASVLTRIAAITEVLNTQGVSAGVGDRSSLTGNKNVAQDALEEAVSRTRFFLWGTLPGMFKDPLLHNYGFVPRQEPESEAEKAPTVA